ncbi:MAG: GNAT family N-acetyltransferase [Xanthomonadales bacterium]|nr:GNAT family N-acetyltransferase [Xanthomonadales bacterium]
MDYIAQLEPESLLDQFLAHPPVGFEAARMACGLPTFVAPYDLLTTLDDAARRRVQQLPGYRLWGRVLRWRTRFVGATVTEFVPLPADVSPEQLAAEVLDTWRRERALLVVKDIAGATPLLSAAESAQSQAFARACAARGCVLLEGMALAWVPIDFASTDDYLAGLSRSRRKNIRRKLRAREVLDIDCLRTGEALFADPVVVAEFYALYRQVYAQSEIHFDLLSEAFLGAVLGDAGSGGLVFTYRMDGQLIGWNLCYVYRGMLVDKYIGLAYPQAHEYNLYVVSWMENLEYARRHGLSHYVAGWTDSGIKRQLGARFSTTRHAVYLRNPLLRFAFRRCAHLFEAEPLQPHGAGDAV